MQPQSERYSSDLVPVANKLHPPTKIVHLPIDLIAVNEAHREVDETVVADLAKSMTAIGLADRDHRDGGGGWLLVSIGCRAPPPEGRFAAGLDGHRRCCS